jgi:protocatechuate 3,4-dioxygenase beta subunit
VHFSLFGREFTQRMVTQMYFPGDPLFPLDPILQSVTDPRARERLVASYDHDLSEHEYLLGYRWDIALTGEHATRMEQEGDHA